MTRIEKQELRLAERKMNAEMLRLYKDKLASGDTWCADDLYSRAVQAEVLPKYIAKFAPVLFRTFKRANFIKKSQKFTLSKRLGAGSHPLPLYVSVKHDS